MIKKLVLLFTILTLTFGFDSCKPVKEKNDSEFTIQNSILNGGNFQLTDKLKQQELTEILFEKTASTLNLKSNQIITLDLFENTTNYVWHSQNIQTGIFYRFISDKDFEIVNYSRIETTEIKEELKLLNNNT